VAMSNSVSCVMIFFVANFFFYCDLFFFVIQLMHFLHGCAATNDVIFLS
jgi:hypothetical protein